jgi:hypothetical protein
MADDIHIPPDVETNPVALRNVLTLMVERINTLSKQIDNIQEVEDAVNSNNE